jgi:hypothetical protein
MVNFAMAKKRKRSFEVAEESKDLESLKKPVTIQVRPKISYRNWFDRRLSEGVVKPWQESAILIFFKKRGLTENETIDRFDEIFKIF